MRPLVDAGLRRATLPVTATSITGYSGGGKKMIEEYEAAGRARCSTRRAPTA
jgi:N-acetyl-gamma-glutamyl-phosphate reductase